ncbi:MAG: histidine phosphatase family protein [Candidatus Diapherotrites archaeon]|nr:histidine phosphatase family protein [Candidatus Diapherotrites archaeon]
MKLYICRHGQTILNQQQRWQGGRVDSALTEDGIAQAKAIAEYLKDKQIDVIFVSPLGRAKETASFLRPFFPKAAYFVENALKELDKGETDGTAFEERRKKYPEVFDRIPYLNLDKRFPGGESHRDVIKRLTPFVERIKKQYFGKTIVVVAHDAVNRMLLGILLSLPDEKLVQVIAPNDVIYEVVLHGNKAKACYIRSGERKEGLVFGKN